MSVYFLVYQITEFLFLISVRLLIIYMFTFQWPWLASLLPLPLLVWYLWPISRRLPRNLPQLRLPTVLQVQQAFATLTVFDSSPKRRWRWGLLWLTWIGLVFALMYPQWLDKQVQVKQTGYDLMLAVDLSGSMETPDFATPQGETINRLAAVKQVLGPFIQHRVGDRVGLILFANQAFLQSPLTLDTVAVQTLLQKALLGMAGRETAIGDAIGLAVKKLRERPESSRILILLTDGDNNAGSLPPVQAAQLAKQYQIRIYTIGVGSTDLMARGGINEALLKQVADLTGGQYYLASDLTALTQVYAHIDKTLQKTEAESRVYLQRTPLYHWPLVVAMLALLGWRWTRMTN